MISGEFLCDVAADVEREVRTHLLIEVELDLGVFLHLDQLAAVLLDRQMAVLIDVFDQVVLNA